MVMHVRRGGKTQKESRVQYSGSLRTADPVSCPHGALGRHLWRRFTADRVSVRTAVRTAAAHVFLVGLKHAAWPDGTPIVNGRLRRSL